ncbi:hypothetical protein DPEC_G00330450 [Dallia pectoralis]|uniref:Uncharacterized protein n=1 Tax=Dallia pectoralis TaxID=75939 RepID=A0ACC2F8W0_DALPE|nr:hypothetical protein DPEC_G00330450 [Dallia pectoralis]
MKLLELSGHFKQDNCFSLLILEHHHLLTIIMRVISVSVLVCVLVSVLGTQAYDYHGTDHYCSSGYSLADYTVPHCYKLIQKQMGWTDALAYCKRDGGTLASVHSTAEYDLILNMVKDTQSISAYAWVGLNDREQEGKYVWTDGSSASWVWSSSARQQQWGNEDCVAVNSYAGAEGFDDIKCDSGCTFVCMRMATNVPVIG